MTTKQKNRMKRQNQLKRTPQEIEDLRRERFKTKIIKERREDKLFMAIVKGLNDSGYKWRISE